MWTLNLNFQKLNNSLKESYILPTPPPRLYQNYHQMLKSNNSTINHSTKEKKKWYVFTVNKYMEKSTTKPSKAEVVSSTIKKKKRKKNDFTFSIYGQNLFLYIISPFNFHFLLSFFFLYSLLGQYPFSLLQFI